MVYDLEISKSASKDFELALEYYLENASRQVAVKFKDEVYRAYEIISRNPFFELKHGRFRAFPLKRFPFLVLFEILENEETIRILSIFHTSQNPKKYP